MNSCSCSLEYWKLANRKLGKVRNLENVGKIIPSFLIPEFSILPYSRNRKLGFGILGKKFPRFPRFPRFPSFRPNLKFTQFCNFYRALENEDDFLINIFLIKKTCILTFNEHLLHNQRWYISFLCNWKEMLENTCLFK